MNGVRSLSLIDRLRGVKARQVPHAGAKLVPVVDGNLERGHTKGGNVVGEHPLAETVDQIRDAGIVRDQSQGLGVRRFADQVVDAIDAGQIESGLVVDLALTEGEGVDQKVGGCSSSPEVIS